MKKDLIGKEIGIVILSIGLTLEFIIELFGALYMTIKLIIK
jgi:hypothetical protein